MERFYLRVVSTSLNQVFGRKSQRLASRKLLAKISLQRTFFSNIDNIDEKIEHCLQLAEDTFNNKSSYDHKYEEFSNPWALSSAELEQDQAFIKYLEELEEPISEDELTEWSNDIYLFMEGLTNPDKLETLWEQSKAKKLWDDSRNRMSVQLDQYLSNSHLAEDYFN